MIFFRLPFLVLLAFLAKSPESLTQFYITPLVGHEWKTADLLSNEVDYFTYYRFSLTTNQGSPKHPLRSGIIGFRATNQINPVLRISTGLLYSSHQFDLIHYNSGVMFTKYKKLGALFGLEFEVMENIMLTGDLNLNHLFNATTWVGSGISADTYNYHKSRMQLGFQFGLAWHFRNYVVRLQYEYGVWNLNNTSEITATTPIKGFEFTIGYQFEW